MREDNVEGFAIIERRYNRSQKSYEVVQRYGSGILLHYCGYSLLIRTSMCTYVLSFQSNSMCRVHDVE